MKTAIIIPTFNRKENLACVLASLANQTPSLQEQNVELIIVDDRSTDGTYEIVPKTCKYIYNPPTYNTWNASVPRNLGAKVASFDTDLFWFLDSDVVLPPDAVYKTLQAYQIGDQRRVLIGSYHWLPAQQVTPDDVLNRFNAIVEGQLPSKTIEHKGMIGQKDIRQVSFDKATTSQETFLSFTDGLACFGGYLLIPKRIYYLVGGYDETILAGCEDGDMGISLYELGVPVSYLKEACGYHVAHEQPEGRSPQEITKQVERLNTKHNVDMIHQSGKAYREWNIDWNPPPEFYNFDEKLLAKYKREWQLDKIDLTMKITKQ